MDVLKLPPCPDCGGELRLVWRVIVNVVSLSGMQMKLGAKEWPHLTCEACGFLEAGKLAES